MMNYDEAVSDSLGLILITQCLFSLLKLHECLKKNGGRQQHYGVNVA